MMTYKIIYTQKALADLDAVASYIKLKLCNISASDRIIENFFGEGDSLTSFPTRYPLCNDAFMSCAKMKVLFMSFVFCMLSVLGKIFCASMSKKKAADLCLFLRHITFRKKQKNMEQNKNSSLGIRMRILRLLCFILLLLSPAAPSALRRRSF